MLAVLNLSYASGRDILYGLSQYARKRGRWHLHLANSGEEATLREIRQAVADGVDGIIANVPGEGPLADFLQDTTVPLVIIGAAPQRGGGRFAFVRNDDIAIGRAGAAYLTSLGRFASYAFIARSAGEYNYAPVLREQGFRAHFAAHGPAPATYFTAPGVERGSYADIAALAAFLAALPKPAAVMAETDLRATHVLEAAARAALRLPKDLALIGVDNDELLCETSEPALTSLAPDHVRLGELAAATLAKLMARDRPPPSPVLSTAKTIVERQSARPVAPATRLVEQASAFIRRNAVKGIGAADVVAHLGVSRRLADARFRELTGESILGAILRTRLDAVKRKLRTTDTPIAKITAACGFHGENYAKKLFRSRFGLSMRAWRAACGPLTRA